MSTNQKRATIKDIAVAAGVSLGSVHCALAGKPGVGEKTRERILLAAQKLNYQPNIAAAALKRKRLRVAVVFPGLTEQSRLFYSAVWDGAYAYFQSIRDMNVELVEYPYYTYIDAPSRMLDRLSREGEVDGVVTIGYPDEEGRAALRRLEEMRIPYTLVGTDVPDSGRLCCVKTDNRVIGGIMAEILLRTIGPGQQLLVCAGDAVNPAHRETVQGIGDYLRENGAVCPLLKVGYQRENPDLYPALLSRLRDPGNKIGACCSVSARGSRALARALTDSGQAGVLPAVGSDIFPENCRYLREGVFTNLIHKNPHTQAYQATRVLVEYLLRDVRPTEDVLLTKSEVIFKSSLSMYETDKRDAPLYKVES